MLTDNRLLAAHHLVHALAAHHQVLVPVPDVLRHELVSAHSVAVHCQNLSHAASQEHADVRADLGTFALTWWRLTYDQCECVS